MRRSNVSGPRPVHPERSLPRNEGGGVEGALDFGLASSAYARGDRGPTPPAAVPEKEL